MSSGVEDGTSDVELRSAPDRALALLALRLVTASVGYTTRAPDDEAPEAMAMSPTVSRLTAVVGLLLFAAPLTVDAQQVGQAAQTVGVLAPHRLEQQAGYPTSLPAEFVPGHLAALPIMQEIARLAADQRAALVDEMTTALRGGVGGDHVTVPAGVHTELRMRNATLHPVTDPYTEVTADHLMGRLWTWRAPRPLRGWPAGTAALDAGRSA